MPIFEPSGERMLPIGKEALSWRCCARVLSSHINHSINDWTGNAI